MKYFIKTYGCKLNHSDSSLMEFFLNKKYEKASSELEADFVVINTCSVVDATSSKILKEARGLRDMGKIVIFGGCLPEAMKDECERVANGVLVPTNIDKILSVVESAVNGNNISIFESTNVDKSLFLKNSKPQDSISGIVAISEGCLGSCTYCVTRLARKKLISFDSKNIIAQINNLLSSGFKEIQLTSQDLAVYGFDQGSQKLPQLLSDINSLSGNFRVKLGMMNPGWAGKIIDDILIELQGRNFYKFLHIPIQSGDNDLLLKMQRGYNIEDFKLIADKFRDRFSNSILSTDIIVGHPLETDEMFFNTVKVLKEIRPEIIHIFKFSKRPNTIDEKHKDLPDRIKKDRSRIITKLFHEMNEETNQGFIGKNEEVLVVERRADSFISRTNSGRAVVLEKNGLKLGDFIKIRVIGSKWNYLVGEIVQD